MDLEITAESGRTAHTIAMLPIRGERGSILAPVLFVEGRDGRVRAAEEMLTHSLAFLRSGGSAVSARAIAKTIGRFNDIYRYIRSSEPLTENELIDFVYLYADFRLNGSAAEDGSDAVGLRWPAVSWDTFMNEIRHICAYSKWCAEQYGYSPLIPTCRVPLPVGGSGYLQISAFKDSKKRSFLSHLSLRRDTWRQMRPQEHRPLFRHHPAKRKGTDKDVMSESFVRDLIGQEANPVYRMIWILSAWGGPRISEQLNLWVSDILPWEWRQRLVPGDDATTPLVILADPYHSTWVGSYSKRKTTRQRFLKERYDLLPRPLCTGMPLGPYGIKIARAGWKGMMLTDGTRGYSHVCWTDNEMASEFLRLAQQLIEFGRHHNLGTRHPWLFVNTDARKPGVLGRPLTMQAVNKAWERACRRLGVTPYEAGRRKHGLRHFYKQYAKNVLGLNASTIKIMMHHVSIQSQEDYGAEDYAQLSSSLNAAIAMRKSSV